MAADNPGRVGSPTRTTATDLAGDRHRSDADGDGVEGWVGVCDAERVTVGVELRVGVALRERDAVVGGVALRVGVAVDDEEGVSLCVDEGVAV